MKRTTIFLAVSLAVTVAAIQGCGDDTDPVTTTATTTQGAGGTGGVGVGGAGGAGGGANTPPMIGPQIDRFGRPAINTALTKPFSPNAADKDMAKDAYNKDANEAAWTTTNSAEFATSLAILDSLDTDCGNQALAAPPPITPTRYAGLAGALANDRLWVNTAGAACTQYLAVEAAAALMAGTEADCGGRTLKYDVIDVSYSVLAAGNLTEAVTDGVEAVPAEVGGEVFPYLAAPH